jgi:predicted unusual protein kinase regulating ubiquinone biosynthesis (AarF/ABC1/UbiB family)
MKRNLPIELDFVYEAANADRVRQMFAHLPFLKVCFILLKLYFLNKDPKNIL